MDDHELDLRIDEALGAVPEPGLRAAMDALAPHLHRRARARSRRNAVLSGVLAASVALPVGWVAGRHVADPVAGAGTVSPFDAEPAQPRSVPGDGAGSRPEGLPDAYAGALDVQEAGAEFVARLAAVRGRAEAGVADSASSGTARRVGLSILGGAVAELARLDPSDPDVEALARAPALIRRPGGHP